MQAIEGLRGAATVIRAGQVRLEAASGPADAWAGVMCTTARRESPGQLVDVIEEAERSPSKGGTS